MMQEAFIAIIFMLGIGLGLAGQRWWLWRRSAIHWQNVAIHYHRKSEELEREKWADTIEPTGMLVFMDSFDAYGAAYPEPLRCAPPGTGEPEGAVILPFRKPETKEGPKPL